MESALKTIKTDKLFKRGEIVGVACSGGIDSMCLLHFLNSIKEDLDIELVAVNIDHQIRPNSADDTQFVADYCRKNRIRCYKFKVNAVEIAKQEKLCLEEAARIARYKAFEGLVEKGYVDKIALGHHVQDQAETILLNIFRGAGLKGASGMSTKQGIYTRPMLNTTKDEIFAYAGINGIEHVEDQTNADNEYSRNYLRNQVMPKIRQHWKNIDSNIISFSKICKQDDEYIESQISFDDLVFEKNLVRIPLYEFVYHDSFVNRVLRRAFAHLNKLKDVEKKHLDLIKNLVESSQNGSKISLPNNIKASLEYDYLTLSVTEKKAKPVAKDLKTGETVFENYGKIKVKRTSKFVFGAENEQVLDAKKVPATAKWRTRELGDVFAKLGSGEKKLKDYFIDKKIPNRLRGDIPVLADGKQIYCVLGYDISEKAKVDEQTKLAYVIKFDKQSAK